MNKFTDYLILRSLVESLIYKLHPLSCIYYYCIFDNYCEVEIRDISDYRYDISSWTPTLTTSYSSSNLIKPSTYPTSLSLNLSYLLMSNPDTLPSQFLSKRKLIQEALMVFTFNTLSDTTSENWKGNKYGKFSCNYGLSASIDLVFVPKMSVIDLVNIHADYHNLIKVL